MDTKTLGRNIRRARQALGLTQKQAATDLECSLNAYTKIERGETNVPFSRLVQIAGYLKVTVNDLVTDGDANNPVTFKEDILEMKEILSEIRNILLSRK